jgi:hypothetical protein
MRELGNETGGDMTKLRPGTRNGAKTLEKTVKNAVKILDINAKIMWNTKKIDVMT